MAKCVVFGGDGFVGSSLAEDLLSKGHKVSIFGRRENPSNRDGRINYIYGDFLSKSDVSRAVDGQEYVFHFITLTNPAISDADPYIDIETNVRMTIFLLECCSKNGVKKVVFPSSGGAIYGDNGIGRMAEGDATYPVSPYAIGKQAVEGYLRYFNHKHGLDYLVLRASNIYGDRQQTTGKKHGVISVFMDNMKNNEPVKIYGDGSMVRDYIYITDFTEFVSEVSFKKTEHRLYNVGSGQGSTVNEIVQQLEIGLDKKADRVHFDTPGTYVERIVLDCSRAEKEFGNIFKTSLKQGIEYMCKKSADVS